MKHIYIVVISLLFLKSLSTAQVVPDLPILIEFFHPEGYRDSIVLGLSLDADAGFDEGLDIIDTTEMEFPLDVRIYDPLVEEQFQFNKNHNLKHSYMSIPNVPKGELKRFEREFVVVVKTDSLNFLPNENLDVCKNVFTDTYAGLGSTFFKVHTKKINDFPDKNTEGWKLPLMYISTGQVYLGGGVDRTEIEFYIPRERTACFGLNSYDNIPYNILVKFKLNFFNDLYLNTPNDKSTAHIFTYGNKLTISGIENVFNVNLYNISGKLVYKERGITESIYQCELVFNSSSIYILTLTNKENQLIVIKKIYMKNI